ncbi:Nuclear pore complex protein Nup205 [Psilocybe cubensis]|uniref:Nuclear pore complex protein Nup205 n=1 Tax=Psilocybe cubensis TaxID=181762 RepID=A0ACB8GMY6_PSICU|nr:Nuclear pore complex protein Nup205 [Psilocybe cubensis]KAH9477078.1 Nuclear pore complex protein Nup205 [Psilocybe cubensis]
METIHRLRETLFKALSPHETFQDEQELFDELMVQKPRLNKLFDVGPRNAQEQRDIESGKPTINGKATAINAEFARQAIFLSQQLDCSEKYIASILHHVTSQNPNIGAVNCMELTIANYHQRRRELVDSLRFLLEATEAAELPDAPVTYKRIASYVRDLLPGQKSGTTQVSMGMKIFKEIELLDGIIEKADLARKNAGSNTVAPNGQQNPSLGFDILNARYESLKYERRYLAIVLWSIARIGFISPSEVEKIVDWLSSNPNHPMTYYFLNVVLTILDPVDPAAPPSPYPSMQNVLIKHTTFIASMTKKFDATTQWKNNGLKAAILLKWTLFLTEARHNDATLEQKNGFKGEELETQVWNAVQGDAFKYLALCVVHFQAKNGIAPSVSLLDNATVDPQDQREVPPADFKTMVLFSFEILLRSLITHASSELRKIKQRQEDLVLATARTDRNRASYRFANTVSPEAEKPGPPPRHDIAMLYCFIGLLYSALPKERALQFWGSSPQAGAFRLAYQESVESTSGRLPSFLQWAIWSTPTQDLTMLAALYDMLSGLANGQQCSELAYNFLARGGGDVIAGSALSVSTSATPSVSWTAIFDLLESWVMNASSPRTQPQIQSLASTHSFSTSFQNLAAVEKTPHPPFVLGPQDVLLARAFLRVMSTVVTHSIPVRTTIASHAHFRAIPTLVSLVPLGIPLELKGAIFETLAAFCEPGAGHPGVEICEAVWTLMERYEIINVRVGTGGLGQSMATGKGVEVELEQVEAPHRQYPSTIPFLKLLCALLHTPKQLPMLSLSQGVETTDTFPSNLGQPYRLPGVGPFTSFVVDMVFANIANRGYSRPSDRWQINDLCMEYVEKSLAGFNLESLVAGMDDSMSKNQALPLLVHPGFDIMRRLLTNTPLHNSIMAYIAEGLEGFENGTANEMPFFRNTIIRVLRIVLRVLEIQDIFLDVFLPLLSGIDTSEIVGHQMHSRSFYTRFDQALSFGPQYVPALATYMCYPNHSELVLLSIKILSRLSLASSPSTLVSLIQRSRDSERILAGFMQVLTSSAMDDVEESEAFAENTTGAGAPNIYPASESLEQAIRLAALDLLIQDTEVNRPYPNVAHFLLFGGKNGDQTIQDPHALGARKTSAHVLLDLVNAGVPRLKGKQQQERLPAVQVSPLFSTLPALAERCYRVIYQLCVHHKTSDFTTRYLRTREDFFARQVAKVPSFAPEHIQPPSVVPPIQVIYNDGSRVTTTVPSFSSFLRLRSYIFDLVALELHILTNKGHHKAVSDLLEILFGTDFDYEEGHSFATFHELGQSPMRVIDFLQSLMFDWADSLTVRSIDMQYLQTLNLQSCIRKDTSGCEIVDRTALTNLLLLASTTLRAKGSIANIAQNEQLNQESTYILESCAVENHRRKVSHARVGNFEAWRRLLDLALTKSFDRLPHNRRENMLFDLLHVLPAAIRSSNIEESTAVLLSETILSSITKLREDRQHQLILQSLGSDSESGTLPAERLYNILRNILQGILDNNHVELVRGNLYAALINFMHLVRSSQSSPITQTLAELESNPFSATLTASTMRESVSRGRSPSLAPSSSDRQSSTSSTLESGCLAVLKPVIERLVTTISRDAIDGTEVWKTVAFMLLDAIVQLSSLEKQHVVLASLNRHGILSNFVRSIKESDSRLQSVLKPDPDDLNSLYVYESKMSLFIRMSQTRAGAERLLEAQLLPILAQCDYLDTRPEADQSFIDQDSFLPSAIQRYHQLFMPALQVVDGILTTLGDKHATATHQALEFLSAHGSTIAILLKNDSEAVTLPSMEEIHLIITLCTSILPTVPKTEVLAPNSGFGAIHLAILGLSTRCLARGKVFPRIVPQTEADIALAQTFAFGYGNRSKFDLKVRRKERSLRKSVVAYIGACSEFTEPDITLVLSPVTITPRNEERATHFAATVPTVGDTLVALDDLCNDLAETLKQISDIGAELANKDQMGTSSAQEILREIDPALLRELEIEQKRSLLCEELDRIRTVARQDAMVVLDTLEMLLLLVWRHLEYYAEPRNMNMPPAKATITNAMRLLATSEPEVFRADVSVKIQPALQRLETLELDESSLGRDWRDNQGYIQIMCRRLRDSAGLHQESSMGGEGD